jgi:hypothetical protein
MSVFGSEIYINPIILKIFDLVLNNNIFDPLVFFTMQISFIIFDYHIRNYHCICIVSTYVTELNPKYNMFL